MYNGVASECTGMVLCGDQNAFCAGADLLLAKELLNTPEKGVAMSEFMSDALNRLRNYIPLVSVSVLSGPALGGGAEMATATDYRVMGSSSYVHFVHAKIGAFHVYLKNAMHL